MRTAKLVLLAAIMTTTMTAVPLKYVQAAMFSVIGQLMVNDSPLKNFPVAVQGYAGSFVALTDEDGRFRINVRPEKGRKSQYEIVLPNAESVAGRFSVDAPSRGFSKIFGLDWFDFSEDDITIITEEGDAGTQATIRDHVAVKGFGDVHQVAVDILVLTR